MEPKYDLRFGDDWTPQSFSDNMTGFLGNLYKPLIQLYMFSRLHPEQGG